MAKELKTMEISEAVAKIRRAQKKVNGTSSKSAEMKALSSSIAMLSMFIIGLVRHKKCVFLFFLFYLRET